MNALAISPIGLVVGTRFAVLFLSMFSIAAADDAVATRPDGGVLLFHDDFQGQLDPGWSFEREDASHWRTSAAGLEVRVQPGNMWGGANNARNVLVRSIPQPTTEPVEISVTISNRPTAQWEQADLVWFYDDSNMVKLGQELVTGRLSIVMGREEGDRARTVAIVPLDAYAVELRLQAVQNRIRGQFRTAAWPDWRDVGQCDLPVKGDPKASLHFYNGRTNDEHWVKVNHFQVRGLPPIAAVDWTRLRQVEKISRSGDSAQAARVEIRLSDGFQLAGNPGELAAEAAANYRQLIFLNRDGSYGWDWERRSSATAAPMALGVGFGPEAFQPTPVAALDSLELELNAVTRLEDDHGDHNLVLILSLAPAGRIAVWFDWYGPSSEAATLHDGYRAYGYSPATQSPKEFVYRIEGFRGAPPRINLKPFLADALERGLPSPSQVAGVWFGNEIWNGSKGGTLVTTLDLVLNGHRYSSRPIGR